MSNGHDSPWTEERLEVVRTMTGEGYGSSAIARAMGCTRNAIIGIRKRKGIQSRIQPKWRRQPRSASLAAVTAKGTTTAAREPEASVEVSGSLSIPTIELGRGDCRYVVNDSAPWLHCAAPGFPWCEQHRRIVWRKAGSVEA